MVPIPLKCQRLFLHSEMLFINLFATRWNHQLLEFVSPFLDEMAYITDALRQLGKHEPSPPPIPVVLFSCPIQIFWKTGSFFPVLPELPVATVVFRTPLIFRGDTPRSPRLERPPLS